MKARHFGPEAVFLAETYAALLQHDEGAAHAVEI